MKFASLRNFIERHRSLFILTGAGCSTKSGIPDYRDADGHWKVSQPVTYQAFVKDAATRRRYWARSLVGWRRFRRATPNVAHRALARLEQTGRIVQLVTQNVDRLHQAAGSKRVIDLHGRLDRVRCLDCGAMMQREALYQELLQRNPLWSRTDGEVRPDGDAELRNANYSTFVEPTCADCGGMLKPDVVFFGEHVRSDVAKAAMAALEASDAMLIVGSSLMVYSGFRFARTASASGKPIAAVNLGKTRADDLFSLKQCERCEEALAFLLQDRAVGKRC